MKEKILDRLNTQFKDSIESVNEYRGELTIVVRKSEIGPVCRFLCDDTELRFDSLRDLSGTDYYRPHDRFEVVYNLYSLKNSCRIRIKIRVDESDLHVPSVTSLWPGANWLEREVWTRTTVAAARMRTLCETFYRTKTIERLAAFRAKYPDLVAPLTINGESIAPLARILECVPWDRLYNGVPAFIHGDLQFDNILHNERTGTFTLVDWRQDFAGEIAFGDLYYDLAKLLGGLTINYDLVKQGLFWVERSGSNLFVDFAVHSTCEIYGRRLREFIESRGLDGRRVRILQGLIYLNMSPLHHAPFDVALHAMGARLLTTELGLA